MAEMIILGLGYLGATLSAGLATGGTAVAIGAGATLGATAGAIQAGVQGGDAVDILKGAGLGLGTGALGGGLGSLGAAAITPALSTAVGPAAGGVIGGVGGGGFGGAAAGVVQAAATGQDPLEGAALGGAIGGLAGGVSNLAGGLSPSGPTAEVGSPIAAPSQAGTSFPSAPQAFDDLAGGLTPADVIPPTEAGPQASGFSRFLSGGEATGFEKPGTFAGIESVRPIVGEPSFVEPGSLTGIDLAAQPMMAGKGDFPTSSGRSISSLGMSRPSVGESTMPSSLSDFGAKHPYVEKGLQFLSGAKRDTPAFGSAFPERPVAGRIFSLGALQNAGQVYNAASTGAGLAQGLTPPEPPAPPLSLLEQSSLSPQVAQDYRSALERQQRQIAPGLRAPSVPRVPGFQQFGGPNEMELEQQILQQIMAANPQLPITAARKYAREVARAQFGRAA